MPATAPFDPERHLRRLAERHLVSGDGLQRGPLGDNAIAEAARALVAVGAIDPALAQAVTDEYAEAIGIRSPGGQRHLLWLHRHRAATPAPAPGPIEQRLYRCRGIIEQPTGTLDVRWVRLSSDMTEIGVRIRATSPRRRRRGGRPGPSPPSSVAVGDDQGNAVSCGFSGGGSELEMRGRLAADAGLSLDTAWIELDGTRLYLDGGPPAYDVTLEPLTDGTAAHRYLWYLLATDQRWHRNADIGSISTLLVDAGAIAADDPVLEAVAFVEQRWGGPRRGFAAAAPASGGTGATGALEAVPERWRSLLRPPRSSRGAERALTVGAGTPSLDGCDVMIVELALDEEGLNADVVVSTPTRTAPRTGPIDEAMLVWWAADDLGNWYLGERGGWSGGAGSMQGTIIFRPQLDHRATEVRLMPGTWREQAVVTIPLDWEETSEE